MCSRDLSESGYYWFKYEINEFTNSTVCYFDNLSKTVTFVGSNDPTPIEHLYELTGSWFGPIKNPTLEK